MKQILSKSDFNYVLKVRIPSSNGFTRYFDDQLINIEKLQKYISRPGNTFRKYSHTGSQYFE